MRGQGGLESGRHMESGGERGPARGDVRCAAGGGVQEVRRRRDGRRGRVRAAARADLADQVGRVRVGVTAGKAGCAALA
jgi:hypothetical protein